ncbi:Predicted oxidoreductase [Palleronia marisminoris]|uniref:L-glyceraldehyde 3-phosphate reductase n=1 Tax=Palleronia marisminoris TaxID=315423 RepID=A0A1Y5S1L8_9RHOB|nr:aldo/keto reductase [Palleronia marisminoris]SFG39059.1 Predicted oxidoreductase [Palleronia marisminoris]SLN29582.1 L-glyceraldehyde 3-phosphate reductase [Palleronia marisminoris]
MKTRKLGAQGPKVSAVGLGAMNISGFYGPATQDEAFALFDRARELGVDHLDTSNVYGKGHSEETIGRYFKDRGAVFRLATKAGICTDPDTGARYFDNSAEHLTASLDASLARLGVECVDLFYVHRREADRPIEEVTETLAGLVRAGKTRAFGYSEIAPASLRRAAAIHPVAAVQSEYSLATRAPDLGLVQTCAALGTALVAFSPVGRGLLTDTPPDQARADASAFLKVNPRFVAPNLAANLTATDRLRELAAEMGLPAASLAIAWLLAQGDHVLPIPGTRNPDHLAEAVRGAELDLDAEDLARIEDALPVGWAHGDRYNQAQWIGPESFS